MKTKKCLRDALTELLAEKSYDKITVSEICDTAHTGRVTFYTYYNGKHDLLKDCFEQLNDQLRMDFEKKQAASDDPSDITTTLINLLDGILDLKQHYSAINGRNMLANTEILFMYYHFVLDTISNSDIYHVSERMRQDLDADRLNTMLVLGFWGFIHAKEDYNWDEIRKQLYRLARDIVDSRLFFVK